MPDAPEADARSALDENVEVQITAALFRAEGAVLLDYESPHRTRSDAYYEVDVRERVHQAAHQAVRDTAAELDVEPAAYYWTNADSIADCTVRCLDEWPELNDVAYSLPGDDRLHLVDEDYLAEQERLEAALAAADVLDAAGYSNELPASAPLEFEDLPSWISREDLWSTPVAEVQVAEVQVAEVQVAEVQVAEVQVEAALEPGQVLQIKESALRADEAVRDPEAVRAHDAKLREEFGPDVHWTQFHKTHERAHEAWHNAIRDKCTELGVGAGAYFHADPDEVDNCTFTCATEWPEITTVAIEDHPSDLHLTLHTYRDPDDLTTDDQEASLQEAPTNQFASDDEWLQSVLDDEPPSSDLATGTGAGY